MKDGINTDRISQACNLAGEALKKSTSKEIPQASIISRNISKVLGYENMFNISRKNAPRLELEEGLKYIIEKVDELAKNNGEEKSFVILVAGGSSSGKTSKISDELLAHYKNNGVSIVKVSADMFFHGPTFMRRQKEMGNYINYDMPEAVDMDLCRYKIKKLKSGESITIPDYNFKDEPIPDFQEISPAKIIILEGMYALQEGFNEIGDIGIFVDVSPHGRILRRITRDSGKNGRTGKTPERVFQDVLREVQPMNDIYVDPQIINADVIVSNDRNALSESVRIEQLEKQIKYRFDNISFMLLQGKLIEEGFESIPQSSHIDTYFEPIIGFGTAGEVFRIRKSDRVGSNLQLTYKFSQKNGKSREERILSFPVEESDIDLIKPYYSKVGAVKKTRIKFQKGNIIIAIDTDVTLENSGKLKLNTGNFIEIQGCKDENELNFYKKIVESFVGNQMTDESYYNMLSKNI